MAQAKLDIDLGAIRANWRALAARNRGDTGAVVKADAYGLGADRVAPALAREGVRQFFVALAEEGMALRKTLGPGPDIFVFSGHMEGDAAALRDAELIPLINSIDQMLRHVETDRALPFGIQLDTGMNRLGMEASEWAGLRDIALSLSPKLIMSHLACADAPEHAMNARQLHAFRIMTDGLSAPRSLSATGGLLLGPDYQFDLCRPGIGLYGAAPFSDAQPVARLSLPVIQIRDLEPGESVGYGNSYIAERKQRLATVAAGYADGILRAMGPDAWLRADGVACKILGRVSMDLITVDVTDLPEPPIALDLLGPGQSVDQVADWAGTIGYEILTSLGHRYARSYHGA